MAGRLVLSSKRCLSVPLRCIEGRIGSDLVLLLSVLMYKKYYTIDARASFDKRIHHRWYR